MISVEHYKAVATDVWMLGMTLYQMLQGYLPFKNDQEILKKDVQFDRNVSEGESTQQFFLATCVFLLLFLLLMDTHARALSTFFFLKFKAD